MNSFMNSIGPLIPLTGIILGTLLPALIVWIVFVYESRNKKFKYDTIIEVSKNITDPEEIRELIDSLKDNKQKKSPTDLRRSGVITIFVGAGLFMLGWIAIGDVVKGVGALVALIGIGQMVAGYIYPNQSEEINKVVEKKKKK